MSEKGKQCLSIIIKIVLISRGCGKTEHTLRNAGLCVHRFSDTQVASGLHVSFPWLWMALLGYNFLRNCQTVVQSSYIIFCSRQQSMKTLADLHACQAL